jgi:hypothetical protein
VIDAPDLAADTTEDLRLPDDLGIRSTPSRTPLPPSGSWYSDMIFLPSMSGLCVLPCSMSNEASILVPGDALDRIEGDCITCCRRKLDVELAESPK